MRFVEPKPDDYMSLVENAIGRGGVWSKIWILWFGVGVLGSKVWDLGSRVCVKGLGIRD